MNEQEYVLKNPECFSLKDIFTCGQCFRWQCDEENEYIGVVGENVIKIKNITERESNHEYGKRTKRNSVRLSTYLLLFLITQYSYLGIARLFNSLYLCANKI